MQTCQKIVSGEKTGLPDGLGIFKPKIPSLDKIGRALEWKMLSYIF
jgi:hypothetical protein